jgi:hypothetical protein
MDFSKILRGGQLSFPTETEDDGLPSITCTPECDSRLEAVVYVINRMLSDWWYGYNLDATYGKHGFDGNYVHTLSDREMDEETDVAMGELEDDENEFVNANREEIKKTFQEVVKQIVENERDGFLY